MTGRPYNAYVDSGVEGMGEVPAHWTVQPAVSLARVLTSTVDKKSVEGELPVRLCNYTDVYYQDRISSPEGLMKATATKDQIARFSVRAGDVPFTKDSESSDDIGIPAFVPHDLPGVVYGYHLSIYRPLDPAYGQFLSYLLQSGYAKSYFETQTPGVTRVGLGQATIRYFRVPTPPPAEALAIATYLDRETAQIDAFIAKNEELIRVLFERRAASLARHLIETDAPRIPLKFLATVLPGLTLGGDPEPEAPEWPYLRVANVLVGTVDLAEVKTVRASVSRARQYELRKGDVLMTEGGDSDKLGRGALWTAPVAPMLHQNHVFAARPSDKLVPEYLVYWLDGPAARQYFEQTAKQTTNLASTNKTVVGNLAVACPDVATQKAIVRRLDRISGDAERAISIARRAIELAKERRSALISAAVTGKIDVGEVA